jgi:hypothetical protein
MVTSQVYPDEIQSFWMILHLFADSITTFYVSYHLSTYQFNHHDMMTSNIHKSTFFVFFTYQSVARGASLRKPHPGTEAIGNGCVPSAEDLLVAWRRV